jgi:general secretion pathway protein C
MVAQDGRPHRASTVHVGSIVAAHLFGTAADDPQDPATAALTTANLVLQGTLATDNPRQGIAIITAEGPAKVYRVGEDVEGAVLHSVYSDRVTLDRVGRFETLALPRSRSTPGYARPYPAQEATPTIVARAGNSLGPRTARNLADVMSLEASVDDDSNAFQGFLIRPGMAHEAFKRSGLRPGDLVTAVNGIPLTDQDRESSRDLVETMLASGNATVSVERNGKALDLSLDVAADQSAR